MSTTTRQRVGIWVITVALTVGTIMGFVAMILSSQDQQVSQEVIRKYQEEASAYQGKVASQKTKYEKRTNELSGKYYAGLNEQKVLVGPFDPSSIKELQVETIKDGDGEVINKDTAYATFYIGFTPDGNIFDGSIEGESLKVPLLVQPGEVISGWSEGMEGKKIGGIYKLLIPSEKAYGASGSGDNIKPNTPLIFIVMPIEKIERFRAPQITQEVIRAYGQQQQ